MNTQTQQKDTSKGMMKISQSAELQFYTEKDPSSSQKDEWEQKSFWGILSFQTLEAKFISKRLESPQGISTETLEYRSPQSNVFKYKESDFHPESLDSTKIQIKCESRRELFSKHTMTQKLNVFIGMQRRSALLKEGHK